MVHCILSHAIVCVRGGSGSKPPRPVNGRVAAPFPQEVSVSQPAVPTTKKFKSLALAAIPLFLAGAAAQATTVSPNTGSLGAADNGTNADSVTFAPGVVTGGGDQTAVYDGATGKTTVPFQSGLNPAATSPLTIEFWANPTASDNDDAPVSNR